MKDVYKCTVCGKFTEDRYHCGKPAKLLMTGSQRLRLSKLVSGLLRHYPWEIGLKLDREGWADIDQLVEGIRLRWRNKELYQWVTREHIIALAQLDPKGRFEIRDNRIRARYGHSIRIIIRYPVKYPKILYHGTSVDALKNILAEGLKPMKRMYVHMTTSLKDAIDTGSRHGKPVVLRIDPMCLKRYNIPVYKASKTIYLAPYVPPTCLSVLRET